MTMAVTNGCSKCLDLLVARKLDPAAYTGALADVAVLADVNAVRLMLDQGADVNTFDPRAHTPDVRGSVRCAAPGCRQTAYRTRCRRKREEPPQAVGGRRAERPRYRETPWRHADCRMAGQIRRKGTAPALPPLKPVRENTIRDAVERSVPLVQRSDAHLVEGRLCVLPQQ